MRTLRGRSAIVTGAAGGLGVHLARSLGQAGVQLMLTDLPGTKLEETTESLRGEGLTVAQIPVDLTSNTGSEALVKASIERMGSIDILVNNAGVEVSGAYHDLPIVQIERVIGVNLAAAMLLARRVLPGMVEHDCGHVVSLASLAGKAGAGFQESYAATKAGLVGFTMSLRGTYRGTGVSASVICPGFVEAGIYPRLQNLAGRPAPMLLGACAPERVARAMVRAIRRDLAEVVINRYPVRPLLALAALFPKLGCHLVSWLGVNDFFRSVAAAEKRGDGAQVSGPSDSSC
jgi:short-subunit dehydrogenase